MDFQPKRLHLTLKTVFQSLIGILVDFQQFSLVPQNLNYQFQSLIGILVDFQPNAGAMQQVADLFQSLIGILVDFQGFCLEGLLYLVFKVLFREPP